VVRRGWEWSPLTAYHWVSTQMVEHQWCIKSCWCFLYGIMYICIQYNWFSKLLKKILKILKFRTLKNIPKYWKELRNQFPLWFVPMYQDNDSSLWFDPMIRTYDSSLWMEPMIWSYDSRLRFDPMIRTYDSSLWIDPTIRAEPMTGAHDWRL